MLINRLRDMYREMTGYIEPMTPVTTVPGHGPAANADKFGQSERLVRCQRRRRRVARQGFLSFSGWIVRTW